MRVLWAVIEDLYIFAKSVLVDSWRTRAPQQQALALPSSRMPALVENAARTILPQGAQMVGAPVGVDALPQKHTIVYCREARVPLRAAPDAAGDTAIATIAYGDMVMVLDASPKWTRIVSGEKEGYVPTETLAHKAAGVYPDFEIGKEYGAREVSTVRLRSFIRDEFSASLSDLPLQAHEYVYYRLVRRGVSIVWPDIRPRTPGSWAKILGTLDSVRVSGEPVSGAVMECAFEGDRAHLAYVEQVFDDGSIKVSEADWLDRGIYNERVLVAAEWRALSPQFIVLG